MGLGEKVTACPELVPASLYTTLFQLGIIFQETRKIGQEGDRGVHFWERKDTSKTPNLQD